VVNDLLAPERACEYRIVDALRLRSVPLFADLSDDECGQIAAKGELLEVPAGAELASQGEFGYSFFIVEEGTADVWIDGERCGRLGPGDVFGEIGLLVTGRRTASVTSSTPMRLLALFDHDFRRLTAEIPAFERCLRHLMASRFGVRPTSGAGVESRLP
jgi:CRP/FNR family cyclic AMP-dependent transcriptional regulator